MYSLPSTSHTWAPRPWLMTGARSSGYWSSALGVSVRAARETRVQPLVRRRASGAGVFGFHGHVTLVLFQASARVGAVSVPLGLTNVTGSGHGMASSGSSNAIVTSSVGSCGRSIRYEVSAVSVSAWKPCAQPAGMYSGHLRLAGQFEEGPAPIGRRVRAQVHDDVEDLPVRAPHQLGLAGAGAQVQAAQHAPDRAGQAVLDEGVRVEPHRADHVARRTSGRRSRVRRRAASARTGTRRAISGLGMAFMRPPPGCGRSSGTGPRKGRRTGPRAAGRSSGSARRGSGAVRPSASPARVNCSSSRSASTSRAGWQ